VIVLRVVNSRYFSLHGFAIRRISRSKSEIFPRVVEFDGVLEYHSLQWAGCCIFLFREE